MSDVPVFLLPLAVAVPIGGACLAPLVARIHRRLPLVVSMLASAGAVAVLLCVSIPEAKAGWPVRADFLSHQLPLHGQSLGVAVSADAFGLLVALLVGTLGTVLLLAALSELGELGERELGWFSCLFLLMLAALIGAAITADSIDLFVWFQVAALTSYGLTGFFLERPIAVEAAIKIGVLTAIAGFLVFTGAAMLYADHGALNLGQLNLALRSGVVRADAVALGLIVAGFATKAGLAPFHPWLPDAHTAAPGPVSALFSGLMVNLGLIGLVRFVLLTAPPALAPTARGVLLGIGALSALAGAATALVQDDLKRLLAWDTVSQTGVIVVGFATATVDGTAGATYHLLNHALFKALLFLCAGAVVHATGETQLSRMGGLTRSRPLLTTGFTVGVLAIAGVPPLNGWASLSLIHESVDEGHGFLLPVVMHLAQVVTVAALARAAWLGFYRRRSEPYEHLERTRPGMRVALSALAAGCVGFGAFAAWIVPHLVAPAASELVAPATYARGVLSGAAVVVHHSVAKPYLSLPDVLTSLLTVAAGLALAAIVLRRGGRTGDEPGDLRVLRPLRALHTGSVNDYAAFLAVGTVGVVVPLLIAAR
jgi:multicomponent Na+:H+ antiporter subunit D